MTDYTTRTTKTASAEAKIANGIIAIYTVTVSEYDVQGDEWEGTTDKHVRTIDRRLRLVKDGKTIAEGESCRPYEWGGAWHTKAGSRDYKLSDATRDAMLAAYDKAEAEAMAEDKAEEAVPAMDKAEAEEIIRAAERYGIAGAAEIERRAAQYRRVMLEGGDGYIPRMGATREQVAEARAALA